MLVVRTTSIYVLIVYSQTTLLAVADIPSLANTHTQVLTTHDDATFSRMCCSRDKTVETMRSLRDQQQSGIKVYSRTALQALLSIHWNKPEKGTHKRASYVWLDFTHTHTHTLMWRIFLYCVNTEYTALLYLSLLLLRCGRVRAVVVVYNHHAVELWWVRDSTP